MRIKCLKSFAKIKVMIQTVILVLVKAVLHNTIQKPIKNSWKKITLRINLKQILFIVQTWWKVLQAITKLVKKVWMETNTINKKVSNNNNSNKKYVELINKSSRYGKIWQKRWKSSITDWSFKFYHFIKEKLVNYHQIWRKVKESLVYYGENFVLYNEDLS